MRLTEELTRIRAACPHDCPDTCAMVVGVRDGRAVSIGGADHPTAQGALCTKVARYLERTYSPERILHPLRRVGRKGEGRFERVSWEMALDEIACRLGALAAQDPQQILPYSYAGTMGLVQSSSMDLRFFHRLGASLLDRTICATAGRAGLAATLGACVGTDIERVEDARLILVWGSNAIASNLHGWMRMQRAKRRGARLVAIDPWRTDTAEKCHEHLAVRPGTDAALALAMMHVLVRDGLIDREYIARHTLGFEALARRVAEWPPRRAAGICGIEPGRIEALARDYGTMRPAFIRISYGLARHAGAGMAVRTIACLPALVGAWRDPAGGLLLTSGDAYPVDTEALGRPDLIRGAPRTINMSRLGEALTALDDPRVRALVVYNSNPMAVAPESAKVAAGFAREDLFTVVLEHFQTDTADFADIVLPATTQLEHLDIHKSYGHLHVLFNQPAIAPMGECKPNSEIFRLLAARMGFDEPCFSESDEDIARSAFRLDHPHMRGFDFAALKRSGAFRLALGEPHAPFALGGFPTASGKCEFHNPALAAAGLDPLPGFTPPRECREQDPERARRYPLAFLSPPARNFLNSSFVNVPSLANLERRPTLLIHPSDAGERGIEAGDRVRVFNDRGAFLASAEITDRVRPGLVVAPSIWWRKLAPGGENANAVTSQALTDLGRGPVFYDCLVEAERSAG